MSELEVATRKRALRLLGQRPHLRAELGRKLGRKAPPEVVETTLDHLAAEGILDDREAAASFVRVRVRKRWSRLRILAELRKRGCDESAAEAALASEYPDELELAIGEVRRRRARSGAEDEKIRAALGRGGFPGHVIVAALKASAPDRPPQS